MKIKEFVESTMDVKDIIVTDYIPISRKREIAKKVLMMCTENNGFVSIDVFKKNLYLFVFAMQEYTKLEFANDFEGIMNDYDYLAVNGQLSEIMGVVHKDYKELSEIVQEESVSILNSNSIETSMAKIANSITSAVDKISNALEDKISGLDINDVLGDINVNELMSLVDRLK